jgi:hypothetical protein
MRNGAVFLLARKETQDRLDAMEQLRNDSFFDQGSEGRSTAEEVVEGVFRAAQREYEERKLRFMASLLSGIAFDSSVDRSAAVALIRTAESLSYRQLCLLAVYKAFTEWLNRQPKKPKGVPYTEFEPAQLLHLDAAQVASNAH